ncbi:hypothetical protein D9M69_651980 [compost metagenome]
MDVAARSVRAAHPTKAETHRPMMGCHPAYALIDAPPFVGCAVRTVYLDRRTVWLRGR